MEKISQSTAAKAASKLAAPFLENEKKLEKEFCAAVQQIYESRLPTALVEVSKKYPSYFNLCKSISLNKNGFSYVSVPFTRLVILDRDETQLNAREAKKGMPIYKKWQSAKDDYQQKRKEIISAIHSCSTLKRLRVEFPEAYTAITSIPNEIDIKALRTAINKK